MSADKLLYDDCYWQEALEKDIRKISLEKKLHLIFTLVMFLQISVAQLLNFIFTSEIKEVRSRAAIFLGHTPTATSKDMEFQPRVVFRAWHENFRKAKAQLHKMIQPCAIEMVLEESDKLIGDKELQVKMKDLTLKSIRTLLQPKVIVDKYHQLAPFTWSLKWTNNEYEVVTFNYLSCLCNVVSLIHSQFTSFPAPPRTARASKTRLLP
jgi:hypothetical protein